MRLLFLFTFCVVILAACKSEEKECELDKGYHSVFQFSDNTMGIAIDLYGKERDSTSLASLFHKLADKSNVEYALFYDTSKLRNCSFYDTTGRLRLLSCDVIWREMKKIVNPPYYIYCTKGVVIREIKDMVFTSEECISNFLIFTIDAIDPTKYGHPLICSKTPLAFNYDSDYFAVEKKLNDYRKAIPSDYSELSRPFKVVAKMDSLYVGYSDNFKWKNNARYGSKDTTDICFFPERIVFSITKEGKIRTHWNEEVDLFGIPCD